MGATSLQYVVKIADQLSALRGSRFASVGKE